MGLGSLLTGGWRHPHGPLHRAAPETAGGFSQSTGSERVRAGKEGSGMVLLSFSNLGSHFPSPLLYCV